MKKMLNVKNSKIYAEMFISRIPKNAERIMMYGVSDKRTMEIILDSLQKAFPKATFVVADRDANIRLLRHSYKGKKFTYINTTDDEKDLALFEEGEIGKMPKFDVAITNPPYDSTLHLEILEKVIPIADKTINISPIGYALDWPIFYNLKSTPKFKIKQYVLKHISSCEILDAEYVNKVFNIKSFEKLAITTYDGKEYDIGMKLYLTDKRKSKSVFEKVILSIASGTYDNLAAHIQISTIHGNPGCKDEFDVVTPQYNLVKQLKPKNMSESDFINWHNSCKTKFMKYCNLLTRQGQHLYPSLLPYMGDYSKPWTDKRFCEYFGITGYIDDEHAKSGSEWETILNTMKDFK